MKIGGCSFLEEQHKQVHALSMYLSYIHDRHNTEMRRLKDYHFLVVGRQFRPTLDDFIEFIHNEKLVYWLYLNWRKINDFTNCFQVKQLHAAVHSDPNVAISKLNVKGFLIQKVESSNRPGLTQTIIKRTKPIEKVTLFENKSLRATKLR